MSRSKIAAVFTAALMFVLCVWIWTALVFRFQVNPDVQLDRISSAHPGARVPGVVRLDVRAFYESRALAPAWVTERDVRPNVAGALELLDNAAAHGLDTEDYDVRTLRADRDALTATAESDRSSSEYASALLDFDVRLTSALLTLGHDVAIGHTPPADFDPLWRSRRDPPNLPRTLAQAIDTNLSRWLEDIEPQHAEYRALKSALEDPDRLAAIGRDDAAAVIAANMERWRWVPDDFGDRHIYVNIPSFTLVARRPGAADLTMRVVVGKAETNETPILSSEISAVVFSPSWNIPSSIALKETVPAQLRDPDYLAKHGIDALRPSGDGFVKMDAATLRAASASELKRMLYRQRPGPDNALGQIKFPFPNEHSVYLHDTPSDGAFGRVMRAISHGCVRLEQPDVLAAYALAGDEGAPGWTDAKIKRAMSSGREQFVKLPAPMRVHLVYFTVSVSTDGTLVFLPDIYHLDTRQPRRPPTVGGGRFAHLF
jgi:murein L,D-transpeptidase YcbB/YkuD